MIDFVPTALVDRPVYWSIGSVRTGDRLQATDYDYPVGAVKSALHEIRTKHPERSMQRAACRALTELRENPHKAALLIRDFGLQLSAYPLKIAEIGALVDLLRREGLIE